MNTSPQSEAGQTKHFFFPFGQPLKKVKQKDTTPKKVFVLGVYASAVHARWVDKNGKLKVKALAVASEPEIFWTGEDAEQIIAGIDIPDELGKLSLPKDKNMNGPSGKALDKYYLEPLGLSRDTTWLCDLLPESRVNEKQRAAIAKYYTTKNIDTFKLTTANIPDFDITELNSKQRRQEILEEIETSKAETIILLGDLPIKWFLRFFNKKYSRLSQFGDTRETYGKTHKITINDKQYNIIPLCHPRQAGRLGNASKKWGLLHDDWIMRTKPKL